jgi:iron complex outermembrane receptor protein
LNRLLHLYPNGATQAEIAEQVGPVPQGGNLPATVYFIYDFRQRNVVNLSISGFDASVEYRFPTSVGDFTVGANVTYFTKFDQNFGGPTFSVLNVSNYNQTFASVRTSGRINLGYERGPFTADLYMNFVGGHWNWGPNAITPITLDAIGLPTGGGDWVKASQTFDLNLAYNFETRYTGASQVFVDIQNLQDQTPPFANASNGVDAYNASILGRVITVGLRTRF